MKPYSVFVTLIAIATFAVVGSAIAGNIPYDPSCEQYHYETQRSVSHGKVVITGSGNIPYDPSNERYHYETQRGRTHAKVEITGSGNIPYDPSNQRYGDEEQHRSYGVQPKWAYCKEK